MESKTKSNEYILNSKYDAYLKAILGGERFLILNNEIISGVLPYYKSRLEPYCRRLLENEAKLERFDNSKHNIGQPIQKSRRAKIDLIKNTEKLNIDELNEEINKISKEILVLQYINSRSGKEIFSMNCMAQSQKLVNDNGMDDLKLLERQNILLDDYMKFQEDSK